MGNKNLDEFEDFFSEETLGKIIGGTASADIYEEYLKRMCYVKQDAYCK